MKRGFGKRAVWGTLLLCLFFGSVSFVQAEVSAVVFTTPVRTVTPGSISSPITIQLHNSSGTEFQAEETCDVVFTSSSATGEFIGSTGKVVSKVISKGTANKTFYYRDTTEGKFTITVAVKGRTSGSAHTVSQSITVSSSTPPPPTREPNPEPVSQVVKQVSKDVSKVSPVSSSGGTASSSVAAVVSQESGVQFEASSQPGFFHRLFSGPIRVIDWVYHFFASE